MAIKIRNGSSAWSTGTAIKVRNGSSAWSSVTTGRVRGASGWEIFFTSGAYTVNSGTGSNIVSFGIPPFDGTITTYFSGWSSVSRPAYNFMGGFFPTATMGSISSTPVINGATVVNVSGASLFAPDGTGPFADSYQVIVSGNWSSGTINTLTIDGTLYDSTPTRNLLTDDSITYYTSFAWSLGSTEYSKLNTSSDSVSIT